MVNESCRDLSSSSDGNAVAMRTDESQRWRGHSTDFVVCLHQLLDLGGGKPRLLHGATLVCRKRRRGASRCCEARATRLPGGGKLLHCNTCACTQSSSGRLPRRVGYPGQCKRSGMEPCRTRPSPSRDLVVHAPLRLSALQHVQILTQ